MTGYALSKEEATWGLAGALPQDWSRTGGHSHESKMLDEASKKEVASVFKLPVSLTKHYDAGSTAQLVSLARIDLLGFLALFEKRLHADIYERFSHRIPALLDPTDWDEEDELPNWNSFFATLGFLSRHRALRVPTLSLDRNGDFALSWRPARDKLVSMYFGPDGQVSWLVFVPNTDTVDDVEDAAGRTTADIALSRVKKYGVSEWLYRPSFLRRLITLAGH